MGCVNEICQRVRICVGSPSVEVNPFPDRGRLFTGIVAQGKSIRFLDDKIVVAQNVAEKTKLSLLIAFLGIVYPEGIPTA